MVGKTESLKKERRHQSAIVYHNLPYKFSSNKEFIGKIIAIKKF